MYKQIFLIGRNERVKRLSQTSFEGYKIIYNEGDKVKHLFSDQRPNIHPIDRSYIVKTILDEEMTIYPNSMISVTKGKIYMEKCDTTDETNHNVPNDTLKVTKEISDYYYFVNVNDEVKFTEDTFSSDLNSNLIFTEKTYKSNGKTNYIIYRLNS